MYENEIEKALQEAFDWASGHRSHVNRFGGHCTTDQIAVMDAQEVVKRSALIQALVALERLVDSRKIGGS